MRRIWDVLAHPKQSLLSITDGAPFYPLVVLFGLNAVDELDRTAFGILVPEIRDEFGLDLQGVLTLIAFVSLCALTLQVPIAMLAACTASSRLPLLASASLAMASAWNRKYGLLDLLAARRSNSTFLSFGMTSAT